MEAGQADYVYSSYVFDEIGEPRREDLANLVLSAFVSLLRERGYDAMCTAARTNWVYWSEFPFSIKRDARRNHDDDAPPKGPVVLGLLIRLQPTPADWARTSGKSRELHAVLLHATSTSPSTMPKQRKFNVRVLRPAQFVGIEFGRWKKALYLYLDLEASEDRAKLADPEAFLDRYEDRLVVTKYSVCGSCSPPCAA